MKRLSGIHLPHWKRTEEQPVRALPLPETVRLPMLMHTGDPCQPAVKKGDHVLLGQLVGEAVSESAVPIHASVSGTVSAITQYRTADGTEVPCVEITSDGEQRIFDGCQPPSVKSRDDLIRAARESGCVGLGGSGKPTFLKLAGVQKPQMLIVNGAECEPYLTSDSRLMTEHPEDVIEGTALIMRLLKIKEARIGIQTDKPAAIRKLSELSAAQKGITVCPLPAVYPQGAEKVVIYHTCGKVIPEGKTAADLGLITLNVSTVAFLYQYVQTGIPMTERVVTVDGDAIKKPFNLRVPIGTNAVRLLEYTGCDFDHLHKLLCGGPMMGAALSSPDFPILKPQNGLIACKSAKQPKPSPCIRCGRCIRVCPLNLMPVQLERAYQKQDIRMLTAHHITLCMNCGCCSYVCPAHRPLADVIQQAKALLPKP